MNRFRDTKKVKCPLWRRSRRQENCNLEFGKHAAKIAIAVVVIVKDAMVLIANL